MANWAVKIDGQAILAPMAGVSDIAYRLLAKEHGAALVLYRNGQRHGH